MKASFDADKAALESEKASLLNCVEDTESQLKLVTKALAGLRQHISQMTAAILVKCKLFIN